MARYNIRPYKSGDDEALLSLHNRTYTGHEDRSLSHWQWKFKNNPLGKTQIAVAMEKEGKCLGSISVVTLPILIDGGASFAGMQIDTAVDPELRSGMHGARLLLRLGRESFARYAGGTTELIWGFPEPGLLRLGVRFLKFEVLREVFFLARKPEPVLALPGEIEVRRVDRFGPDVDALWQRCAVEINTGVVRNARYLNWRFADHPDWPHQLIEARDRHTQELRGITALHPGGWDPDILSMVDWLVPEDDRAAEAALLSASLQETARQQKTYLISWFPGPRIQFYRLQVDYGFFVQATPYMECFRPFRVGMERRWLEQHWYQTMGDIDFF